MNKIDTHEFKTHFYQTKVQFDGQIMTAFISEPDELLYEIRCFFDGFRHMIPKSQDHFLNLSEFIMHLAFIDQCQKDWGVIHPDAC